MESLDGYRAIAAVGVVISHTAGTAGFVQPAEPGAHLIDNLGNFGVAVFFVISGFVIFRPFVAASLDDRPRPQTVPYLIRRGLRLFPGYWLALTAWALFVDSGKRAGPSPFSLMMLTDPYTSDYVWLTGLYVAWTLTIEVAFYLFLPIYTFVVATSVRRLGKSQRLVVHLAACGVLYFSAFAYRSFIGDHWTSGPPGAFGWLPGFFDWFALGMTFGVLSSWRASGNPLPRWLTGLAARTIPCWSLAAMCYMTVVLVKGPDRVFFAATENTAEASLRFMFQGWAAFFLLLPAILGRPDQRSSIWLSHRLPVFLGSVAYGIYLWHPTVIYWFDGLFSEQSARVRFIALTALVLAATIPIATMSYRWVERPAMQMYRPGVWSRRRAGSLVRPAQTTPTTPGERAS